MMGIPIISFTSQWEIIRASVLSSDFFLLYKLMENRTFPMGKKKDFPIAVQKNPN